VDREYVYRRDGGKCHICGDLVAADAFTLDHLIALDRGGPHAHDNVCVAHGDCNSRMSVHKLPAQLLLFG
jgi:5-methylcytosine-specific restriction endonuclease McrA